MRSNKEFKTRLIAFLLALILLTSLVGCAEKEPQSTSDSANTPEVITEPEASAQAEPQPTSEPSEAAVSSEAETISTHEPTNEEPTPAEESSGELSVDTQPTDTPAPLSEPTDTPAPFASPSAEPTDTPVPSSTPSAESTATPAPSVTPTTTPTEAPTTAVEEPAEDNESTSDGLTSTQRNSINMLNYMTVLTQQVNEARGNQLFLESAYSSLVNDIYPNSVDTKTQGEITRLLNTINEYRMISVKRQRLEYIYEQNRAQAMRQAIPNPMGLLSAVQSGSLLKAAASVLYMAVDSATSYQAAASQADLEFLKDGWELDDAEMTALHNSTRDALTYLLEMVRLHDLPGDYALNEESVKDFVLWSGKPDSQLVAKISWFESHESTYSAFGPYWLELAKDYYNSNEYEKCLQSINQYEAVATRIFRKDIDYAQALPMAIISAKETYGEAQYVEIAANYCKVIMDNTKDADWTLRYFAAQIYLGLYSITNDSVYLDKAYKIAYDNIVVLVDEQRELNAAYLADIEEAKPEAGATKREKDEVKSYNKFIKEERKKALPPVSEALYLNCDLLFALAEKRNITDSEKRKIESVLHENGEAIFLTAALDARFWYSKSDSGIQAENVEVTFDGEKFVIPATCIADRSTITATISSGNGTQRIDDWSVSEVKRPRNAGCDQFGVTFTSRDGKAYKYQAGETVTIRVTPVAETPNEYLEFTYNVVGKKTLFVFDGIEFERTK